MNVTIKTPAEQDKMRAAGRLAASVLDMIEPYVQPGVSTGNSTNAAMTSSWRNSNPFPPT